MKDSVRERSVNNLQRLYTVVVSLAITESLRRVLPQPAATAYTPDFPSIVAVISLLFTIVPFYHGANRYLDATYVTGERKAKSEALMLDFVAIFLEGLAFFALATLTQNTQAFFTLLAALFVFDAAWVGVTNLTAITDEDRTPKYRSWAIINLLAAGFILLSIWSNVLNWQFWHTPTVTIIAVGIVTIARTVYDYISVWSFYYPPPAKSPYIMPVPRPAPVPRPETGNH